jgi:hypothetical protein
MAPIATGVYGEDVVRAFALPDLTALTNPAVED